MWLFLSTFNTWTYFMKSRYYFTSPGYIVIRPQVEKTTLFFVFCIAIQPPTLFWDRIITYSISLSIQKKLVFNQKLVIKKEKYYWKKWPIPNELKPHWLHRRLFGTKPVAFDRTIFYCEQQHSQIYTELPFCFEVHKWIPQTSESKENSSF